MKNLTDADGNAIEYFSAGMLCAILGRLPKSIQAAASEMGEQPMKINGLDHYTHSQLERIDEHFRDRRLAD